MSRMSGGMLRGSAGSFVAVLAVVLLLVSLGEVALVHHLGTSHTTASRHQSQAGGAVTKPAGTSAPATGIGSSVGEGILPGPATAAAGGAPNGRGAGLGATGTAAGGPAPPNQAPESRRVFLLPIAGALLGAVALLQRRKAPVH